MISKARLCTLYAHARRLGSRRTSIQGDELATILGELALLRTLCELHDALIEAS